MTNIPGPPSQPPSGAQPYGAPAPYGPPPYGPPPYGPPPYGPPPYGSQPYGPPPRSSSTATIVTALLAVLFVAATALAAWSVHDRGENASASPALGTSGGPQQSGGGVPGAAGPSYSASTSPSFPTPSSTTSAYVPPPTPTPTRVPLEAETINRTFQVYMNALLNRSLSQLKLATCPRLRKTETGTALDGRYISRWQGHRYTIYNSLDYVIIGATVRYVNPNTGGNGGTHRYSWYVTRYPDGHYWVCGIL